MAWDALKDRISTFENNFNRRLESAMKDDDDDEMVNKENDEPQTNDGINDPMTQQRKFRDTGRNDAQVDKDAERILKEAGRRRPAE
jgi:hypothetical protein